MKRQLCIILAAMVMLIGCQSREAEESSESASASASQPSAPESSRSVPESSAAESSTVQESQPEEPASVAPAAPTVLTLVIPEGYTLARIGMLLEEKGVCTVGEFIEATQNFDSTGYVLLEGRQDDHRRCFTLEGYLFPATYEISTADSPDAIVRRMVNQSEQRLNRDLLMRIDQSGYSVDEIITMASIIEKEAFGHDSMRNIASVLHNRLFVGMQLQCDVTINYVEGAIKPFITGDINYYNSYYNTYKCAGLPAGPICNPGMAAIEAALNPTDTDYYYFVTDAEQNYYFAATWDEHQANVRAAGIQY